MLKTKTVYDNREEFCGALRKNAHLQCRGLGKPLQPNAHTCFFGIAMRTFQLRSWHKRDELAKCIGISERDIDMFIDANDEGHSFYTLANQLEKLPFVMEKEHA